VSFWLSFAARKVDWVELSYPSASRSCRQGTILDSGPIGPRSDRFKSCCQSHDLFRLPMDNATKVFCRPLVRRGS
jgi:hypothetical protein